MTSHFYVTITDRYLTDEETGGRTDGRQCIAQ